jgi:hypothetical protein
MDGYQAERCVDAQVGERASSGNFPWIGMATAHASLLQTNRRFLGMDA